MPQLAQHTKNPDWNCTQTEGQTQIVNSAQSLLAVGAALWLLPRMTMSALMAYFDLNYWRVSANIHKCLDVSMYVCKFFEGGVSQAKHMSRKIRRQHGANRGT